MSTLPARLVPLELTRAECWTLHHVLLERLDAELTATDPTAIEPPPLAVYRAFDTLETDGPCFTVTELTALTDVLARAHAQPAWAAERDRLEQLLQTCTRALEQCQPPAGCGTADD